MCVWISHNYTRDQDGNGLYQPEHKGKYGSIPISTVRSVMAEMSKTRLFSVVRADKQWIRVRHVDAPHISCRRLYRRLSVCVYMCITRCVTIHSAVRLAVCLYVYAWAHSSCAIQSTVCPAVAECMCSCHEMHAHPYFAAADTVDYKVWEKQLFTYTGWTPEDRVFMPSHRTICRPCMCTVLTHRIRMQYTYPISRQA